MPRVTQSLRVAIVETLDPEGALPAWMSPQLRELGHEVVTVPVQELLPRLGIPAWQDLLLDLERSFAPHLVLVHPPYDFLGIGTARDLRAGGARLVGFAFDDPIFLEGLLEKEGSGAVLESIRERFDLYATTSRRAAGAAKSALGDKASYLRWAVRIDDPVEPAEELETDRGSGGRRDIDGPAPLLMLGAAYPRRIEMVSALARRGITVEVAGRGWPEVRDRFPEEVLVGGPVPGHRLAERYRRAAGVICPADREDRAVPMVKSRLLEVTGAGGLALAEDCAELEDYFDDDEVLRFTDVDSLGRLASALDAGRIDGPAMAKRARARTLTEHTWSTRWPELLELLERAGAGLVDRPEPPGGAGPGAAWRTAVTSLALDWERRGATAAAAAAYRCLEQQGRTDYTVHAGLGRCLYAMGRHRSALHHLDRALSAAGGLVGEDTSTLPVRWEGAPNAGLGLGHNGHLAPRLEILAFRLAALLGAGEVQQALDALAAIDDPGWVVAISRMLGPTEQPGTAPFWQELARRTGEP